MNGMPDPGGHGDVFCGEVTGTTIGFQQKVNHRAYPNLTGSKHSGRIYLEWKA
jgi:hypothetical protein